MLALCALFLVDAARPAVAAATLATAIGVAEERSCALTDSGGVRCWGRHAGDGFDGVRLLAVDVSGATSGIATLAAGDGVACVVTTGGEARCWGNNSTGAVGDGTTERRLAPVQVVGLGPVATVGPGYYHSCAVTTAGAARCWGNNDDGQLGDGTATDSLSPVDVVGLASGVAAIAAGNASTCALTTAGGVKCWGNNVVGNLGDGTTTASSTPVDVVGLATGVVSLVPMGNAYCALVAAGGVKCWGQNNFGQLGDGSTTNRSVPVDVIGLTSGVIAIGGGANHACAVNAAGGVACWGGNGGGQLGDGTTTPSAFPVAVVGLASGMASVDGGDDHTCARSTTGAVACWGRNGELSPGEATGELGDGTMDPSATPVNVVGFGPTICPNPGGERTFASKPRPRLVASRINAETVAFNDKLTLVAQIALPPGVSFAMLDPLARGARIQLHAANGEGLFDVTAAAGAYAGGRTRGWRTNASGSTWTFIDRTVAPRNGLTKVQLVDRSRGAAGGNVKLLVTSKAGNLPVTSGDVPLHATIVLGDASDGASGKCGVSDFAPGACRFNPPATTVTCAP